MYIGLNEEQEKLRHDAPRLLREAAHAGACARTSRASTASARRRRPCACRWRRTAGSASAGRRSTAARAATPSITSSSSTSRCAPRRRCRCSPSTPSAPRSCASARRSRSASSCRGSSSGEIEFCIGYTEPNAGTDLASLQTRAVRDGDHYVVNGQKIWTSLASDADYCWLAVRTDPNAAKHAGISMLIVDMKTPGHPRRSARTCSRSTTSTRCSSRTCACPPRTWWAARTRAGS